MPLSLEEQIFLANEVYSHGGKYSEYFQRKVGRGTTPNRHCVVALMKKFEQTGSVQDRPLMFDDHFIFDE